MPAGGNPTGGWRHRQTHKKTSAPKAIRTHFEGHRTHGKHTQNAREKKNVHKDTSTGEGGTADTERGKRAGGEEEVNDTDQ